MSQPGKTKNNLGYNVTDRDKSEGRNAGAQSYSNIGTLKKSATPSPKSKGKQPSLAVIGHCYVWEREKSPPNLELIILPT